MPELGNSVDGEHWLALNNLLDKEFALYTKMSNSTLERALIAGEETAHFFARDDHKISSVRHQPLWLVRLKKRQLLNKDAPLITGCSRHEFYFRPFLTDRQHFSSAETC